MHKWYGSIFCFLNSGAQFGGRGQFTRLPASGQSRSLHSLRKLVLINIPEPVKLEKSLRYGFPNRTQEAAIHSSKVFLRRTQ